MEVLYTIKSVGDIDSPGAGSTQTRAQDTHLVHIAPVPGPVSCAMKTLPQHKCLIAERDNVIDITRKQIQSCIDCAVPIPLQPDSGT